MKRIFTLFFLGISVFAVGQSNTVVISQVYPGGGSSSATVTYTNDYVELHNNSVLPQDISGWSIQYGSAAQNFATNASNMFVIPANTILSPGQYYLVQLGNTGTGGAALPVTPDATSPNVNASASSGKIALVSNSTALGCGATATPCSLPSANIVDLVSYGAANNAEGDAPANGGTALTSNQYGIVRNAAGCQDTDNNNADFTAVQNPVPRNSLSLPVVCSPLPLQLTSFTAALVNGHAQLSWTTANETDMRNFIVERSVDGRSYNEIVAVVAENGVKNTYSATDNNTFAGANYYSLKMVNKDGSFRYSDVVVLNNRALKAQVFPNPVTSNLTVSHERAEKGAVIRILSVEGKQVKQVNVQAGTSQSTLNVSELLKGNYLLVFESDGAKATTMFTRQ